MTDIVERLRDMADQRHMDRGHDSVDDALREAADEIERTRGAREWLPIETAPTDGTDFIGWNGKRPFRCRMTQHYVKWPHEEGGPTFKGMWSGDYYDCISPENPTHWMPLPSLPEQSTNPPIKEAAES